MEPNIFIDNSFSKVDKSSSIVLSSFKIWRSKQPLVKVNLSPRPLDFFQAFPKLLHPLITSHMRNENKGGGILPSLRELAEIDLNTSGENAISSLHQSTIRQFLFLYFEKNLRIVTKSTKRSFYLNLMLRIWLWHFDWISLVRMFFCFTTYLQLSE